MLDLNEIFSTAYGFTDSEEATPNRVAINTAYAAAGGSSKGTGMRGEGEKNSWILRSPGEYSCYCDFIEVNGSYDEELVDGNANSSTDHGVRPVLHLDLSNTNLWQYAGQVKALKEQKVTANSTYVKTYGDPVFHLNAKASGNGSLSYISDDENVVKVDENGNVTIVGAGTAKITVTASETQEYAKASRIVTVNVKKAIPTLTTTDYTKTYGDKAFNLGATAKGKLTYKSSDTKAATVDKNGKVTIKAPGVVTITVSAAANTNYEKASKTVKLTIEPKKVTFSKLTAKAKTMTVTWKKDLTVTGYQIQYATNKKFTNAKTIKIAKASTTKKTISKLKSKKTYYVRIRSYKKSGSNNIYGAYSLVKKVKI